MKTALILTTYNRPHYLDECLNSLKHADLSNLDLLLIIDDHSTDPETISTIYNVELPVPTVKKRFPHNVGIKEVLKWAYGYAFESCDVVINLDGDAVVRPDFINRLLDLKKRFPDSIVSGFDSRTRNRNPIISEHRDYLIKKYVSGINMVLSKKQFKEAVFEREGNWDFNLSNLDKEPKIIAKPSLVQHIGLESSMGHNDEPDVAHDFYLHHLPDVTLFGIDAHDPQGILRAAEISQRYIKFGAVKIITERLFSGREAYSEFCIKDMVSYIDTSHVLIIHADGYVQNPYAWRSEWLEWDYIGATWDWYNEYQNGNGGFSLRSKRLLEIISKMDIKEYHPEDSIICRELRPQLEQQGIRFAPVEVCKRFSIEAYGIMPPLNKYTNEFGFHGYHVQGLRVPIKPSNKSKPFKTTKK